MLSSFKKPLKPPEEIKTLKKISWYTDLAQELEISDSHFLNFFLSYESLFDVENL